MAIQIQIRRDTASNWSSNNPTLAIGELGFVTDTLQLKIGSGSVAWNSLPYFLNSASATTVEIAAAVANLIDLSPETLNTLNELAAAIGDDANFFNTVNSNIVSASAYALSQANAYADGLTTADVAENTNLYFTNERAVNAGSATYILQSSQQGIINSASAAAVTSANSYTDTEVAEAIVTASAAAVAYADGLTTTEVAEGTSLYFTNERAVNAGSATYILQSSQQGIINSASAAAVTAVLDGAPGALDTLNELAAALNDDASFATTITNSIAEKLSASTASTTYATITSLASASAAAVAYADALTTADVAENTNLYFTNERAVNAGSATYILQSSQQGIINSASAAAVTAVINGAPGALDTLDELAAALGDDQNFAATVTNSLAEKLSISTASATYLTQAAYASASPNFATDAELASAIVTASAAAVAYADGLTTTDVAEGTNLYYTNTRGLETASTAFVHANHIGMSASFTSNQVRFDITEIDGGGV
jgi:hypothetical protein